jgi:cytochrome c
MDSPTGRLLGKSEFIGDVGTGFAPQPVAFKIDPVKGKHDVFLMFQNPEATSGSSLMVVMNTTFKNGALPAVQPTTNTSIVDLNVYAGKYKMTGLPFPYIEISVKDNKLIMDAGGQVGEIKPTGEPDQFDSDGKAVILFLSSNEKKFDKLRMDAMGFSFEGAKE